ncbi:MAG: O-antigen ligase family protein [bacterium]
MRRERDGFKLSRFLFVVSRISTYIFIAYVLTDLRQGGDLKYVIPYLSGVFSIAYLVSSRDYALFRSPVFLALLGYVCVSYLLVPLSFNPHISFIATNREILSGMLLFISLYVHTSSQREADSMARFLIGMLVVILLGGFLTYLQTSEAGGIGRHLRPDVHMGFVKFKMHHNGFAMIINILLPVAVAYCMRLDDEQRVQRYSVLMVILLSGLAVFLSLSRGGWASLFATSFLWLLMMRRRMKLQRGLLLRFGLVAFVFIVLLWIGVPDIRERVFVTADHAKTLNSRTQIWERHVSAIEQSPLFGWGYGDNILWDGKPFTVNRENKTYFFDSLGYHAHNMILQVLYHQGIIGLVFFGSFLGAGFWSLLKALRAVRDDLRNRVFLYAFFCMFISVFVIHGLIEIVYFTWICLCIGFLMGLQKACGLLLPRAK